MGNGMNDSLAMKANQPSPEWEATWAAQLKGIKDQQAAHNQLLTELLGQFQEINDRTGLIGQAIALQSGQLALLTGTMVSLSKAIEELRAERKDSKNRKSKTKGKMKKTIALLALLSFAGTMEAKPRIADKKFWVMAALAVGSSIAATQTIHRCRQDHGIGPCVGGDYGPFSAKESIRISLTSGLVVVSYFWKKLDTETQVKHSFWWTLPASAILMNGGTITRNQFRTFTPEEHFAIRCHLGDNCAIDK